MQPRPVKVEDAEVRPWFTPRSRRGSLASHREHIGKAKERIRIGSPVLTSGPILGTLVEVVNEGRAI